MICHFFLNVQFGLIIIMLLRIYLFNPVIFPSPPARKCGMIKKRFFARDRNRKLCHAHFSVYTAWVPEQICYRIYIDFNVETKERKNCWTKYIITVDILKFSLGVFVLGGSSVSRDNTIFS